MSYKLNTIRNLYNVWMSSSHSKFHKQIAHFFELLPNNNYPDHIIHKIVNRNSLYSNNRSPKCTNNDKKIYYSMPYFGKSSMIIRKILYDSDSNLSISFGKHCTGRDKLFSKLKDKLPLRKTPV